MFAACLVKRLSLYRRVLGALASPEGWAGGLGSSDGEYVFSHDLASLAGVSAAQVRRDVMTIGYTGSPRRGYDVAGLIGRIGEFLDAPGGQSAVLVGLGHLGKAVLAYVGGRRTGLRIVAGFDVDPAKCGRVIHGCRCHGMEALAEVIAEHGANVGLVAVPGAEAQNVSIQLVRAGVRGLLNFAPVRLQVPEYVFVEDVDITVSLESVAFFARHDAVRRQAMIKEAVR
ncbi:MAG: redox-sensing transcriptional repressor Rex [Phycisphaerae bacterium]|nr:redox-sensing transcriptional repressor Rex [Phycisphaerae bacterium]